MIEVRMGDCYLELTGHAGWGQRGQDVVCAAATCLAYTLAYNLQCLDAGDLVARLDPGDILIQAAPEREARKYFRFVQRGLRMLEQNYPENIFCHVVRKTDR